jgi:hypothetical protein
MAQMVKLQITGEDRCVFLWGLHNHVPGHATSGDRAILYATQGGENIFTVIAVGDAGNRSEPASITIVSQ